MSTLVEAQGRRTGIAVYTALALAVTLGLVGVRIAFGYLLFHGLVELVSIAIAAGTFMVTWNLRRYFDSGYLLVVAVGFFFAAGVDALHTFAYSGMNVFQDATADLPTQLWLIARYVQAGALVVAPAFARRKAPAIAVFWSFAAVTAALLSTIFVFGIFPTAFVEGTGLTPFKIYSEYAISFAMALSLAAIWKYRATFPREVLWLLTCAIVAAIASELAFTLYADPYAAWNMIGHLLKVLTFFLLYRAIVETVLVRPFDVLFGDLRATSDRLSESEERFRSTFEQATLGIAHVDPQGRWLRLNQKLAEITGYPMDELLHLRPEDITHPEDRPTERALIEQLISGKIREYRLEKRYIRKDGSIAWVEISRTLLRAADGAPKHSIAIVENINARKAQEHDLIRSRDLTEALNSIDLAINATTDSDEITRTAAEEGCRALGAESAAVLMCDRGRWRPAHLYRFPHESIPSHAPSDGSIPVADENGSPLVIDDAYHDDRMSPATMRTFGIRSLLTVPLRFRGSDLGVIYFNYHSGVHRFTDPEVEFAKRLSSSTTQAIENARLAEAQRAITDTLESALLHMPDAIPGIEFAHAYRSATELARIGGDFYDLFEAEDQVVAFMLGDVSGKGLEAATLTAMAKSTIRAFAYQDHRPAQVLESANAAIASQVGDSRFITAIYGTIDTRSGRLRIACAGHPQPVLCSEGMCGEHFIDSSPPLGVLPDTTFAEFETVLDPDTLLVIFSDGLIEARAGDEFLGEKRVSQTVQTASIGGPAAVIDALLSVAEEHSGGKIGDDVAAVVLRFTGTTTTVTPNEGYGAEAD